MIRFISFLLLLFFYNSALQAQNFIFAELNGNPVMNTTGWNLTGNAVVGNTNGTPDNNNNELILTQNLNTQSGGIFWQEAIDLNVCTKWFVDFEFRIFDGNGADGLAFCFLDVPPAGFVSGGGVGIPGSANGLKVVFDTFNNCGGPNPEIQIFSGVGYNECAVGIIKLENNGGILNFIRSNNYNTARITYDAGNVEVIVNGTSYLTGFAPANFVGFMGFTASTGGSNDRHSIRNVTIFTEQAIADAGADEDAVFCSGGSATIGTANNPDYVYSWSPSTGLNSTTISNPTVTLTNNGSTPITQVYTVTTSFAANPGVCPTTDEVTVTVNPIPTSAFSLNNSVCQGVNTTVTYTGNMNATATFNWNFDGATIVSGTGIGPYQLSWATPGVKNIQLEVTAFGCTSTITNQTITVIANTASAINPVVCNTYTAPNGQVFNSSGTYTVVIPNAQNCDSTITINLTVNQSNAGAFSINTCNSYTWLANNQTYTTSGTYTTTLTNAAGCDSVATLNLTIFPSFNTTVNEQICAGESIVFQGNTYTQAGTYPVMLQTVNGCDSLVQFILQVNPLPVIQNIDAVDESCFGYNDGSASATIISGTQPYSLLWNNSVQGNQVNGLAPFSGYSLLVTDANGCNVVGSFAIAEGSQINVSLVNDTTLYEDEILVINAEVTGTNPLASVVWEPNTGLSCTSCLQPQLIVKNDVIYTLRVTDTKGCFDEDFIAVFARERERYCMFPQAFSPNGDGVNDVFKSICLRQQKVDLSIYNRWGELVYAESGERIRGWDGTYKTKQAPVGVYIYKAEIVYENGRTESLSGNFSLIR